MSPNSNIPLDPACNSSESCQPTAQELCFNPNSNKPLATELVNSSFSKSYQQVMQIAHDFQQTSEALSSTITQIQSDMGDVDDLETVDKSSLVGAINDVNTHAESNSSAISNTKSELGNLNSLTTDNKSSIVGAINEVDSHTDTNTSSISRIDSEIGTLSSLDTDNKSSLVGAINEVDTHTDINTIHLSVLNSEVGSLNKLKTDDKTSLVDAINEVNDNADYNTSSIARVQSDVGSLGSLITDNKTSIVGAINEIDVHADTNAVDIVHLQTDMGDIANLETVDKSSVVKAINEVNSISTATASSVSALQTADAQNVKLTGDQTVAGVKTFSDAPVVPSLTSSTQIESSEGVGFDKNGRLIPIKTIAAIQLPPSADYIGSDSAGDAVKKTADTTVTSESSALVTSGAVFNSVKGVSDKVGDLTSLDTTDKSNLVSAINEVDSALSTKSDLGHKHSADDITSGVLPIANGGTGATTAHGAFENLANGLVEGSNPEDTEHIIFKNSSGKDWGLYKLSHFWEYIKGKISSVLGLTKDNYGGKASTATTADYAKNMYQQTFDLTSLDKTKFYPLVCSPSYNFAEVAILSEGGSISVDYNQNRIHFDISTTGWSDTPFSLNIREYACFDNNEIAIGCIGRGNHYGAWALWLRGGVRYICYSSSSDLSLKTSDYTYGDEIYTVGTNYYGGTNSNVNVVFTPQATITEGAYSNRPITASTIKAENDFIGNLTGNSSTATSVVDFGAPTNTIKIGYNGAGITASELNYIAGYKSDASGVQIKDVSKDVLQSWLGIGSLSSLTTTDKSNLVSAINEVKSELGEYKLVVQKLSSSTNAITTIPANSDAYIASGSLHDMISKFNGATICICSNKWILPVYPATSGPQASLGAYNPYSTAVEVKPESTIVYCLVPITS